MTKFRIVNVVATASLDQELDFGKLRKFKEISHDPKVYGGRVANFKKTQMQGRISLFCSGKMISVGTINEQRAFDELELAMQFLTKKGLIKKVKLFPKIQNIVVTADFECDLILEQLAEHDEIIYEPEQFPGAILRIKEPHKTTVLIFASGKATITGLKSVEQISPTIKKLESILMT